ncbi:TetR/AcrR family transcriptional regulator [Phytohabitans sp. LJ34]|uniref:TetR/AcrR family transcriptional regulator n=1 Tax=Phytohabitans sp. LJ34 TaxID=3452217 RepID=UPI003F88CB5D
MPRRTEAHLAARRRQIIDAARTCFLRKGFQATSMQEVIEEAGLSVGAVYRYFSGKEEIVLAVAEDATDRVIAAFVRFAADPAAAPLLEAIDQALAYAEAETGPGGAFPLALEVWAGAARDPGLHKLMAARYAPMRATFVTLARRARDRGELAPDADVGAVGAALFALVPGWAVQHTLTGEPDRRTVVAGLRALIM